ncbi:MAG TPA: hypothetical protein VMA30_06085 [Xanthobacteraceae bacterium]|nr:hypothetical protein [Xanthobacteraceae bacterium]
MDELIADRHGRDDCGNAYKNESCISGNFQLAIVHGFASQQPPEWKRSLAQTGSTWGQGVLPQPEVGVISALPDIRYRFACMSTRL